MSFRPSRRINDRRKKTQSIADIVMDARGYVYCTWRDSRSGDFDIYFARDESVKSFLKLLAPLGGEVIPSGSNYSVEWAALSQAVEFDLYFSMDGGKSKCKVKVALKDAIGKKIEIDVNDRYFMVQPAQ